MDRVNIKRRNKILKKIVGKSLPLQGALGEVKDFRKQPQIPLITIFLGYILRPFFNCPSLNSLDKFLRDLPAKKLFKAVHRMMVFSASLLRWVFSKISPQDLKRALIKHLMSMHSLGAFKNRKGFVIGSVDGSFLGGGYVVCLQIASDTPCMLAALPCKRGGELKAAYTLLEEAIPLLKEKGINGPIIVCVDGLYFNRHSFNLATELDIYLFVRYTPHGGKQLKREILQEAQRIFNSPIYQKDVKHKTILKLKEGKLYEVKWSGGFRMEGVEKSLYVIMVKEKNSTENLKKNTT